MKPSEGGECDYHDNKEERGTYVFAGCDLVDVLSICEDDALSV